ncbi:hypothetical protein [Alicyclobacillus mengziensis]|uniref:Uncharacterized protein n=1 Tax=Alicyclobacillus mengziensis TaxID=2931921 RepID=A0A9X7W0H8_9BACL|nr:hypothetical protein [Alicyclobacillus mengziensis]QSO47063.1 hypothetical protein JZ786_22055 [Alicyclobacillus mengziensis]
MGCRRPVTADLATDVRSRPVTADLATDVRSRPVTAVLATDVRSRVEVHTHTIHSLESFDELSGVCIVVVVLNVKVTGSAEIVVTAGSSPDPSVVIANYLGWTIGDALHHIMAKGYRLSFVTDRFFVCTKGSSSLHETRRRIRHRRGRVCRDVSGLTVFRSGRR